MALGASKGDSTNEPGSGSTSSSDKKQGKKRTIGELIDFCAKTIVLVVGLPIRFAAAIVNQFVANGGAGRAVVGGLLFIGGSMISADSVWQLLFLGRPVFPWFEETWAWQNVLAAVFNPFFYMAFLIAVGLQVVEAHALRGKNPDSARRELQDHMVYDLETKPGGKIDLVGDLWKDYKTAGVRDRSSAGFVTIAIWVFDLVATFAARNPFAYTDPLMILGCILFNVGTMLAGEMGFAIWKMTKD
ncbi:MAG: hypothetical protein KME28_13090 [Pelatocladus maniniholoensis HA4357-MV3]|jgi:hypothetical protein|uniref:Uncharacterized protein n=1 Tax=Pelatocladus maniniholoensis HA4357-MV3 TaxID=1117104 RepID=A0A9E3H8H3_9NOST|nr:hypothetical protein [Pelatocladus maniniholoensis HA4357-MV3]BAZ65561.1 hypothetical protein NIES4106_03000 [Fischerella sp. NIES-4106]